MRTVSTKGWLLLAASAALGVTVGLARCFSPQLPTCAYICNKTEPRCPDEYECRADCYCHLKGSTEGCGFPQDLGCDAATPAPDLASTPKDLAMAPPDLAGTD